MTEVRFMTEGQVSVFPLSSPVSRGTSTAKMWRGRSRRVKRRDTAALVLVRTRQLAAFAECFT